MANKNQQMNQNSSSISWFFYSWSKKMSLFQFLQGWSFQSVVHRFPLISEMAQEVCEVKTIFLSNDKILFALFTMSILVEIGDTKH